MDGIFPTQNHPAHGGTPIYGNPHGPWVSTCIYRISCCAGCPKATGYLWTSSQRPQQRYQVLLGPVLSALVFSPTWEDDLCGAKGECGGNWSKSSQHLANFLESKLEWVNLPNELIQLDRTDLSFWVVTEALQQLAFSSSGSCIMTGRWLQCWLNMVEWILLFDVIIQYYPVIGCHWIWLSRICFAS